MHIQTNTQPKKIITLLGTKQLLFYLYIYKNNFFSLFLSSDWIQPSKQKQLISGLLVMLTVKVITLVPIFSLYDFTQGRNYSRAEGSWPPSTFEKKYLLVCILTKRI